jgi:hypothetical protein
MSASTGFVGFPPFINTPVANHGAFTRMAQQGLKGKELQALTGLADVINPHQSGNYMINSAAADLMTFLSAPAPYTDDGNVILLISNGDFAHTLTAAALINAGVAGESTATFAAFRGATLALMAYQGEWFVLYSNAVTFT